MKELGITLKTLDATIEKAVADFYKDLTRTVVAVDHGNLARIRKEAQGTQEKLVVPEADASLAAHGEMRSPVGLLEGERPREPQQEDSWTALKNTLTTTERAALSLALRGANLKAFADEHNIMLEVLADSINEKAADFIGDNLLDEDMTIYDDYKTNVTEMVR